jgi:hypothetical protein
MAIERDRRRAAGEEVRLGLRANWPEFALLVAA